MSIQPPAPRPDSRFRLFVFDLDGTLIDSRRDLAASVNALLSEYGARPLPEDAVGRMVGDGAAMLVARALTASGLEPSPAALQRFLEIYNAHLTDHTRPYPGIAETLRELGRRAALAVLTNKPIAPTRTILDRLGLARYFAADRVIGGDGLFPRKPDPSGLRFLARTTAIALEETLMVGDSTIDCRTAEAAPTAICLAMWGFGCQFPSPPPVAIAQSPAASARSPAGGPQSGASRPRGEAIFIESPTDLLRL